MNETDLLALITQYMVDKALIVVAVLLVIGVFLKRTPRVPDWLIPWILTAAGICLAFGAIGEITIQAAIQGILAAGIASLGHQLWKQTTEKK